MQFKKFPQMEDNPGTPGPEGSGGDQTIKLVARLKQNEGLKVDKAYEMAMYHLPDGPAMLQEPPPKVMNSSERKVVYRYLDRIGHEEEKLESRPSTKI